VLELETDAVLLETPFESDDTDDRVEFADELLVELETYELEAEELETDGVEAEELKTDEVEIEELEIEEVETAAVWAASDFWIVLKTLESIQVVSNELYPANAFPKTLSTVNAETWATDNWMSQPPGLYWALAE
jgi:hypothetical protein